jgi:hypothetical protein
MALAPANLLRKGGESRTSEAESRLESGDRLFPASFTASGTVTNAPANLLRKGAEAPASEVESHLESGDRVFPPSFRASGS